MFRFLPNRLDAGLGNHRDRIRRLEFLVAWFDDRLRELEGPPAPASDSKKCPRYQPKIERRSVRQDETQERSCVIGRTATRSAGSKKIISGEIPYNSWSQDLGGFTEQIERGAFKRALDGDPVTALWAHDSTRPLASTNGNSLQLHDAPGGLRFEFVLRDNPIMLDLWQAIERGDAPDVSFGFEVVKDRWEGRSRTLVDVRLAEITIGLYRGQGAYSKAGAQASLRGRQFAVLSGIREKYRIATLEGQFEAMARAHDVVDDCRRSMLEATR